MKYLKRFTVALLVAAMILSTAGIASATPSDVAGTRFEESVEYLRDLGVIAGYPDGTFKPEATIARAEAVKIIVVMKYGSTTLADLLKGAVPFSDVAGTHWASGFIALAKNAGIVNGYPDGTFKPEGLVTYAEMAKMLVEAAGLSPVAGLGWPSNYVSAAQTAGMLGSVPDFAANSPAIRGDCAIMAAYTAEEIEDPATGQTLAESVFGRRPVVASIVVTPATASLAVGQEQVFTAAAYDAAGQVVSGQTFSWTAVGGAVDSAGKFVASTSGTATITAKIGTLSGSATATVAGTATKLALSASPTSFNANAVATSTVTARVVDAQGNTVVTDSTTKVTFTVIGPATLPAASQLTVASGVCSITVTSTTTAGTPRITATATGGLTGAYIDLTTVTPVATQVKTAATYTNMAADGASTTNITATIADAQGEKIGTATNRVTFTLSSETAFTALTDDTDASLAGIQLDAVAGVATLTLGSKTVPGSTSVTASATALTSGAAVTVSSYVTGTANKLYIRPVTDKTASTGASSGQMTVKVEIQDFNGNIVNSTAAVTLAATEKGTRLAQSLAFVEGSGPTVNAVQGVATFKVYDPEAESIEFKASCEPLGLTQAVSNTVSGAFNVGSPAKVKVTGVTPGVIAANGLQTATVTAKIYDTNDNFCSTATNEVTFTRTIQSDTAVVNLPSSMTTNAVAGVATITVTARTTPVGDGTTHGQGDKFSVTGKKADGAALAVVVADGVGTNAIHAAIFGPAQSLVFGSGTSATVGSNLTIKVYVRDYQNKTIASDQGRAVTLYVTDGIATVASPAVTTVNGVATFTLTSTKVETLDLRASSAGLPDVVSIDQFSFTVGAAVEVRLSASPSKIAADGSSFSAITAKAYDASGNSVATLAASTYTLTATPGGAAASVDGAWRLTSTSTPATVTVSGTVTSGTYVGLPVTPVTVTTYIAGTANRLSISAITSATAGSPMTVSVWVQDYNGNNLTSLNAGNGTIVLAKNEASTAVITGNGNVVGGKATFTVNNTKAETVSFTATATGLTQATASGTFTAGASHHLKVTASPNWITADGFSGTSLTVKIVDAYGNLVSNAFGTATLALSGSTAAATLSTTDVTISGGQNVGAIVLTSKTSGVTGTVLVSASAAVNAIQPALSTPDANEPATVGIGVPLSGKAITGFTLAAQTGAATIDAVNRTVAIQVANGTIVTALVPTITVSEGASISPASGVAQNFTNAVVYTVTAGDLSTAVWTVTVTVAPTGVTLTATVQGAPFGCLVTANSNQAGGVRFRVYDVVTDQPISGFQTLGQATTVFPAKNAGASVVIRVFDATDTDPADALLLRTVILQAAE